MGSRKDPFVDLVVDEGSIVILSQGREDLIPLQVTAGKVTQTRYGAVDHKALIGVRFGSRFNTARGFVWVLPFTPELWTLALPHRTQVLYAPDISLIITMLDLAPGRIVAEAGTGSGSLTHALARAVFPSGRIYTFDFHEERVSRAQEEFTRHHLSNIVICNKRDVIGGGFGLPSIVQGVILDLPNPWEAIPQIKSSLKLSGARLCFFSPCIEQVQRTRNALMEDGCYGSITTLEVLRRRMDLCKKPMPVANVGQSSAQYLMDVVVQKSKRQETFNDDPVVCSLIEDPFRCQQEHHSATVNNEEENSETQVDSVIQPNRFTGHTGYLTFASYIPKCL